MKKSLCLAICALIISFPNIAFCGSMSAAGIKSGHSENGAFVIPIAISKECDVKLDEKSASKQVKKCLKKLIKEKSKDKASEERVSGIFSDALKQSELESLKAYLAEKIYASYYEEEVVKPLQEEMKGSAGDGSESGAFSGTAAQSANSGEGEGDSSAVNLKEDWANIAKSDTMLSAVVAEHLNNVLATEILHEALKYLSTYGSSYAEEQ